MFGESFDLAILSGPLALQRAKQRAKRFWWSGYAIAIIANRAFFYPSRTIGRRVIVA
ncbi:MAG: hypothetical protein GDA36_12725 [Rhodobacteraceae bacterium]|nr:hypothetical protein [Paracoccaceae bacterium]